MSVMVCLVKCLQNMVVKSSRKIVGFVSDIFFHPKQ